MGFCGLFSFAGVFCFSLVLWAVFLLLISLLPPLFRSRVLSVWLLFVFPVLSFFLFVISFCSSFVGLAFFWCGLASGCVPRWVLSCCCVLLFVLAESRACVLFLFLSGHFLCFRLFFWLCCLLLLPDGLGILALCVLLL